MLVLWSFAASEEVASQDGVAFCVPVAKSNALGHLQKHKQTHKHTHTHRSTQKKKKNGRQTNTQTDRRTQNQTMQQNNTQTNTQTNKQAIKQTIKQLNKHSHSGLCLYVRGHTRKTSGNPVLRASKDVEILRRRAKELDDAGFMSMTPYFPSCNA